MALLFYGKPTKLQAGDLLVMDVASDIVHIEREGLPLAHWGPRGHGDARGYEYHIAVQDGLHISEFIALIADAAGLRYEELGLSRDCWRFRFI